MRGSSTGGSSDYKMVLVIRGELRLTSGKAAVQVAHAAVLLAVEGTRKKSATFQSWWDQGQKKIAVVAQTLDEMEGLAQGARRAGLPFVWVEDAGFTEVPPGTRTCLGLGPARSDKIDPLTRDLPLL
jgi:peptidyl-tRNA hydrolase, PTH2 family